MPRDLAVLCSMLGTKDWSNYTGERVLATQYCDKPLGCDVNPASVWKALTSALHNVTVLLMLQPQSDLSHLGQGPHPAQSHCPPSMGHFGLCREQGWQPASGA